ncbi:MAG: hypothetical protein HC923_07695 [Myxococcales bacterium]|nr:hypothetical protein [Myxococcales bacterium]
MRLSLLIVAAGATVLLTATSGGAQTSDAPLGVGLEVEDERLEVSFDVTNAFTEAFRRRFLGGITSRARIRTIFVDSSGREFGRFERVCEMRFDVWDELAYVRISDEPDVRSSAYRLVDDALSACGSVDSVDMLPVSVVPLESFRVLTEVVLNPVSEELLDKTREFMSNPSGASPSRPSIFGALARLFRSNDAARGESFLFRSPELRLKEIPS